MIVCKIPECNKEFKSQRSLIYHIKNEHKLTLEEYYNISNNIINVPKCKFCDNYAKFNERELKYNEVCSNKSCICKYANEKSKQSVKEKYGVDNVSQLSDWSDKVKQTKLERYGDANYNNIEKNKQTCKEKYGVDNVYQRKDIIEKSLEKRQSHMDETIKKIKSTNLEKYGHVCSLHGEEIKEKVKRNNIIKYGVIHPMKNKDFYENVYRQNLINKYDVTNVSQYTDFNLKTKETIRQRRIKKLKELLGDNTIVDVSIDGEVLYLCPVCNEISKVDIGFLIQRHKFNGTPCLICNPYREYSKLQKDFTKYIIDELKINNVKCNYIIPNDKKEIDIYLPDYNIGIEINGVYWHDEQHKMPNYHAIKKSICGEQGINVINLWEDDLNNEEKLFIIKNRLKNILNIDINKIGARKCKIKEVNKEDANLFINKYHLNGNITNVYKYIGLYYNDELISCLSIGKRNNIQDYEILRYCIKFGYNIIGGFNKIISYIVNTLKIKNIFTYVDLDWCNGRNNIYENSGMQFVSIINPNYYWVVNGIRKSRQLFTKKNLVAKGKDPNKTEVQIMHDDGYYRIYNCGSIKYKLNNEN